MVADYTLQQGSFGILVSQLYQPCEAGVRQVVAELKLMT